MDAGQSETSGVFKGGGGQSAMPPSIIDKFL